MDLPGQSRVEGRPKLRISGLSWGNRAEHWPYFLERQDEWGSSFVLHSSDSELPGRFKGLLESHHLSIGEQEN